MQSAECILRLDGKLKGMNNEEKRSFSTEILHFSLFTIHSSLPHGGVAQLGEHLPCKQGVMGSNPIISTKDLLKRMLKYWLIAQVVRARA